MARKASAAAFAAAATADARAKPPPTADALERVRDHVRRARDTAMEIADKTAALNELKQRQYELLSKKLPDMFRELGISSLGLEAEGNNPAYSAVAAPYYRANISADWDDERRAKAFKWLRDNDLGDLIKAEYSVEFGMKTEKQQRALVAALKKLGLDYHVGESVPWNTLTAVVRDMVEREQKMPPLETLGATVGTVVTVKEVKPTTSKRST